MIALLMLLWVVCAVASYAIASHKHNHPRHAFFTGLLLGPFGLAAVVLWKDSPGPGR